MSGQSILVTGAGSGIGLSIVKLLLADARTALVVAVDINTQQLVDITRSGTSRLQVVTGDVSLRQVNEGAVASAIEHSGRLDAIILNAGILGPIGPVVEGDVDGWRKLFDINFFGVLHGIQTAFPHLQQSHGRIILTSSGVSLRPTKSWAAYSCGKAALNHLCSSLSQEEESVPIVSITPGIVDTAIQRKVREQHKDSLDAATYKWLVDLHKEGKLLHPDRPAASFVMLALGGIPRAISGKTLAWDDARIETE